LATNAKDLVSVDFFTVSTVRFELLFVLIILAHDRRRARHFNITAHPTAAWTAQQIVETFPWKSAPRCLLRDRDRIYGTVSRRHVAGLGITEVLSAPRRRWQSPYVERLIGSIRRECRNNVVVLHERHLRRLLTAYFQHYHRWRSHQALAMDCPEPRPVQGHERGTVVEVAEGGGLYRRYERRAA